MNTLQLQQLDEKMQQLSVLRNAPRPPVGWIKAIRLSLGMSLQQLANKLNRTRQSILELEEREKEGSVTLKSLREAAKAMDMQFVYALIPIDGSLDQLMDRKARELATAIVMRTSYTMLLENQEITKEQIQKAIEERTKAIKNEMPKALWD